MTRVEKTNKVISTFVVCLDAITISISFLLFYNIWNECQTPIAEVRVYPILFSLVVSYIVSSFFRGTIIYYRRVRSYQVVQKTIGSMILFMLVWWLVVSLLNLGIAFNKSIIIFFVFISILIVSLRLIYHTFLKLRRQNGSNICKVIYIGSGSNIRELYKEMTQHLTTGYNVVGYFDKERNSMFDEKCTYLGSEEQVIEYMNHNNIDSVYCGLPSKESNVILPVINYCEGHLIRFFSVPNFRNYCRRRVSLEMFSNVPLLTIHQEPLNISYNRIIKRLFDIVFSLCFLLTAFIPICIIVGIITKITSPGPIFFKQKRHGLDGKEFCMYKFRSMHVNSDADKLQATKDDPRKTKFGNFMRKTNIDELPQFFNVLLGDMSIVGPRPHMLLHTEEYSKLISTYMVRHFIKPGVTGWAQVTGFRGETKELSEMKGRVKADIWYMEHWMFTLDLYIIYKTVANVIGRKDSKAL